MNPEPSHRPLCHRKVYSDTIANCCLDEGEEESRQYRALANMDQDADEDEPDNEEMVSSDSGHSSDTDIDAAVHEYRDAVEVINCPSILYSLTDLLTYTNA